MLCKPAAEDVLSSGDRTLTKKLEHHTWSYSNFVEMRERLEALLAEIA